MVKNKLCCVNLHAQLWDCWLTCDTIYSQNLTVKGGTYILHNLIRCKLPRFSRLFSGLVYCYGSNTSWRYYVGQKNFLSLKHIQLTWIFFCKQNARFTSTANFTSKISISGLLIKLHNFQWIKTLQFNCV